MERRYALLLDGGFLKYQLGSAAKPIEAADVLTFVEKLKRVSALDTMLLHRIYFYDSHPLGGTSINPLDGSTVDFGASDTYSRNSRMHALLCKAPHFSMRFGELHDEGWELHRRVLRKARPGKQINVSAADVRPSIGQKGVDMRIGLDIASLTLKKHVDVIVLVTADSDFIPAMKFARREGAQLFLVNLGHGVREGMHEHADLVIDSI